PARGARERAPVEAVEWGANSGKVRLGSIAAAALSWAYPSAMRPVAQRASRIADPVGIGRVLRPRLGSTLSGHCGSRWERDGALRSCPSPLRMFTRRSFLASQARRDADPRDHPG